MKSKVTLPICRAIVPAKQGARRHYGSHPYFTKRAWNVVQEYVRHFSSPGETVLDPFGGSGVTAVESLVLGRKAIYLDISRWACFLARQTAVSPVNLIALREAFGQVEDSAREYIESLWRERDRDLRDRPVADWYPRNVPLPQNADVQTVEELFTPRMLHGLARLRASIMKVGDESLRSLLLMAFSATLARINRTFLSTVDRAESRGGSAIFSIYRYKIAKQAVELPLWEQFSRRVSRLLEAKQETNQLVGDWFEEGRTARFLHGSATRLAEFVNPGSVDYIYTDPPYGAHIAYLDLSTMWAAWLGFSIDAVDRAEEVIEGGDLRKSREDYHRLLKYALDQMAVVLKSGRWLSLVFAHRDTAYWEMLVEACREAGFEYVNTVVQPVGVVWSMHKKKNPLRVLSGELVLNFTKARSRARGQPLQHRSDAAQLVVEVCEREIVRCLGCTTEDLHHAAVPALLEHGLLGSFSREHGDLTPLLEKHFVFDKVAGRWNLGDRAVFVSQVSQDEQLRYLTHRLLDSACRAGRAPTESELLRDLQARFKNGERLSLPRVRRILDQIGSSADGRHWMLAGRNGQHEFAFSQSGWDEER